MGDTSSIPSPKSASTETSKRRTNTEAYKAETLEFLDKAWGKEEWKPPTNIPRRDGKGTPFPPNKPWTVGELDVLKDITIAALSRDILPLCALYEPGGAIFEAAVDSGQLRWCIKVCANARRVVRESAEPRLTKKEVFDMVMAGTLGGKAQVRDLEAATEAYYSCMDYVDCLLETPSFADARPVCHCGLRESVPEQESFETKRKKLVFMYFNKNAEEERRHVPRFVFGNWRQDHLGYPLRQLALR